MIRIQIKLTEDDFRALRDLADQEYRDLRQQAGILIHDGLIQKGFLQPDVVSAVEIKTKSPEDQPK